MPLGREGAVLVLLETEQVQMEGSSAFSMYLKGLMVLLILKQGSTPLPFLLGLPPSCFNVGLVPCQLIGEMNKQDFPAAGK